MNLQISELQEEPRLFLHTIITLFLSLLLSIFLVKKWLFADKMNNQFQLPPSPPKLPVIGNLHQLGLLPHRSLHSLSLRHGPLMLLSLGSSTALVVSSAEAATEIFRTHDIIFSSRPASSIARRLFYDRKDLVFSPYGEYWRQMRSISVLQLLSSKRVCSFRAIREEEAALMISNITHNGSSGSVDLSEMLSSFSYNVACRVAFGRRYSNGEDGKKFKKLLGEFGELMGTFDVGSFIPWLSWINYATGLNHRVERVFKEFDLFLDRVIDDHATRKREEDGGGRVEEDEVEMEMDFVDIMLKLQEDGAIDRDNIKAILLDVFTAGTETSFTVLEWAMTELLRHPQAMKEAQKEVRGIVGTKPAIAEADTEKMDYLRAVIKETLRMHTPLPLLVPRETSEDVKVLGYDIPAKTTVLINAWAIGRDPVCWEDPEEFKPERFVDSSVDFRGHDLQLIPFGTGRRGCPGITFAISVIELALASLLQKLDWALPDGAELQDLDMTESAGISAHKKIPLLVVPIPRSF